MHQVQDGFAPNVVVGQHVAVLELLAFKKQALLTRGVTCKLVAIEMLCYNNVDFCRAKV